MVHSNQSEALPMRKNGSRETAVGEQPIVTATEKEQENSSWQLHGEGYYPVHGLI